MVRKDSSSSDLEKAYNELKASFYQNFTKFTMFLMILTSMIEIIRAIYLANPSILVNPLGSLVLGLVLYKYASKKMFIFTLFTIVALTVSLYGHYTSTGYFNNPADIFYFAYTFSFLERLFGDRIPTVKEKAFFSLANAIIRIIIVPLNDKGLLVIQAIFLLSLIFCDFNQESHYKDLFGSYYQSKDQLGKFKDLVENYIPEGIIVIDQNSKKSLFVNNAFKGLFEFSQVSDVTSQLDSFHLCDSLESSRESYLINSSNNLSQSLLGLLNRDFSQGSRCTSEKYHLAFSKQNSDRSSKKEEKIFEARILNIVWDEVPAFAIVLHDITQQQTILKLKVAADLNKDKVLATVSHELRTPLNGILGVIQIMNKKIHDPELLQYLKICKNSANLLIGLVNSILDLNQIRANKLKLSYDKVQLHELLKDIVYLFEFQCNQKNILLDLHISPKTPTTIITDKNRLTQIFINLLGNALKFTIRGSITIIVKESSHPDMIQFGVKDTGMGIKEEDKDKLFMMYGRLDQDDDKINQQGVGLGLTISNNLAHLLCEDDRLGGIKVESEYKQGSAFTFLIRTNLSNIKHRKTESGLLIDSYQTMSEGFFGEFEAIGQKMKSYQTPPIKRRSVVPEITTCAQSPLKSIGSQKNNRKTVSIPTILIVDENPFNITIATELINMEGFNVKSALYGQTAIDIALNNDYKTDPIELILMDCQMPVMDGYETTKILRKLIRDGKIPDIPIVALTANNNSAEEREECKKAGMCDYLTKPLREANLAQVLKKYTSKHDN